MARWVTHRSDRTAKDLIAYAESKGALHLHLGGAVDSLLLYRSKLVLVDWKAKGTKQTQTQQRLVQLGWPLRFIETREQVDEVLG